MTRKFYTKPKLPKGYRWVRVGWMIFKNDKWPSVLGWKPTVYAGSKCRVKHFYIRRK